MGRPGSATTLHYNGSPRTLGCLRAYTFHHNGSPRTVFSGGQAGGRRAGKLSVARAGGRSVARAVWRWRLCMYACKWISVHDSLCGLRDDRTSTRLWNNFVRRKLELD